MLLKNLINNCPKKANDLKISGLALSSKDVKKGYIFFAIRGNKFNGEDFINSAIKKGQELKFGLNNFKKKKTKTYFFKTQK